MCTVSWLRENDGYALFCNRDERSSRRPALGPHIDELNGVKYVAPVDGDHSGSWIGVNQFGITLCLLNHYCPSFADDTREFVSRGLLLIGLMDASDINHLIRRTAEVNMERFRPFSLLALARTDEATLFEWSGAEFTIRRDVDQLVPLSSTSLMEPQIAVERRKHFAKITAEFGLTKDSLERFHRSHLPERGAYSVCMHRDGASTVSFSKVIVTQQQIVFRYQPGSPCERNSLLETRMNFA